MHRLFLGLPIPGEQAALVEDWATRELNGVRVLARCNLHVTLLFFGEVSTPVRDELVDLTQAAWWEPMEVETGELDRYGRTAFALRLGSEHGALERLAARVSLSADPPEGATGEDPLYQMALRLPEAELARLHRRRPHDWSLHLTVGRSRAKVPPEVLAKRLPPVAFALDRLALYESHLAPSGSDYSVIAEGRTKR